MNEVQQEQIDRLVSAGIHWTAEACEEYVAMADDLGEHEKGYIAPPGFKRCGRCGHVKKFYLFNKNSSSKTNTSGNCKECQKKTAANSYSKTKKRRNYKKYYQENKEIKQAHARKYYQENKEIINAKHRLYLQTKAGKKVMMRAHKKRREALANNKGVPYTREMVIERDGAFLGEQHPICYLCNTPILDTSGSSLHIDHVVPVVEGGLDCFTNVASVHAACNLTREKDARELTVEQITHVKELAHAYMDQYPEKFE